MPQDNAVRCKQRKNKVGTKRYLVSEIERAVAAAKAAGKT